MSRLIKFGLGLLALAAIVVVSAGLIPQASDQVPKVTVRFLDVGQGDAILITTPHRERILIDGGPDSAILTRLGAAMPFFAHDFALVIATHNHADHITGLNAVMERYTVRQMWLSGAIHTTNEYLKLLGNINTLGIPTKIVKQGDSVVIDEVSLTVLHPTQSMVGARPDDQHDATIVVRACYLTYCFLLTGDLDEGQEQAILNAGLPLQADVLKVPHHGSKTGLAVNFLQAVNPKYAVIEVGAGNRYGHPAPSAVAKLAEGGITTYRTDQNGTVTATVQGDRLTVTAERPSSARR